MTFEEYLISKKIDLESFQKAESALFESWKSEFAQLHPASFSAQKLYLINPVRRKYPLRIATTENNLVNNLASADPKQSSDPVAGSSNPKTETHPPKPPRPVFKPKPKIS